MIMLGGDKKKLAQMIVARVSGPEGAASRNEEAYEERAGEPEHSESDLHLAAQDIMNAIKEGDVIKLSECLQAFFEICDEMPHEEGEHIEE